MYFKKSIEEENGKKELTKVRRFRLTEISVEIGSMRLLQTRAQPKVRKLYMTPCVQQQVVRFDISVKELARRKGREG